MSICIENVWHQGQQVNILIEGNRISRIAQESLSAQKMIDGNNKAVLPSLVNGHTHAAMTLLRGYADDMNLQPWLTQKIWPLEAKLTEEDVYWGSRLACLEMIKSGTTLFNDMYWHHQATVQAVEEMGIRMRVSQVFMDFFDPNQAQKQKEKCQSFLSGLQSCSSRILPALGPHSIYTVSGETLQWVQEFARAHQLPVHIHLAETETEDKECREKHGGLSPVFYLQELGFLGANVLAAHAVWLSDEDLAVLGDAGVRLIHNPCANLKLSVGKQFPSAQVLEKGISWCLGTDGCASNNNLNLLEEAKFAALCQKWYHQDPTLLPCEQLWSIITQEAHEIFQVDAGKIAEGKLADLLLVDLDHPQMVPCYHLISNLIYAAESEVIDTVICDGKVVMENRVVPGEEEIFRQVRRIREELLNSERRTK